MNIKELLIAIKNDYTDIKGEIYTEKNGNISAKEALALLANEVERLQEFEYQVKEKEELESLACILAVEEESPFAGLKSTEIDDNGVGVEVYCDFWDFSGGTNDYYYTWEKLRSEMQYRYPKED